MANVTITLADEVIEDARAQAKEHGMTMSAWVALLVRQQTKREARERSLLAYKAWRPSSDDHASLDAFDQASRAATAASWQDSAW